MAKNSVFHKKGKHIVIRCHFTRERIEMREIDLEFVRTFSMATDQLTKHVGVKVGVQGNQ